MKKLSLFLLTALLAGFSVSCGGGSSSSLADMKLTELNLTDKGIPVTFQAPEGTEIKDGMFMGEFGGIKMYDYEIVKDEFVLEVSMDDTEETRTVDEIISDAKETAKTEDGFVEFVKEETNGFIYKVKKDDYEDYKFHYVLMKDGKAIEFAEGLKLFTEFSLKDAETLYDIAKNAK
jgi:hypothetical protein